METSRPRVIASHALATSVIVERHAPIEPPPDLMPGMRAEAQIEAVFTYCDCGPKHREDCEFWEDAPPSEGRAFWSHVREQGARSVAAALARNARGEQWDAIEHARKAVKPARVVRDKRAVDPRQMGLK